MAVKEEPEELNLWVKRWQQGDREAWRWLYQTFQPQLLRFALRVTADPDLAWEAVQETFIDLYRARTRYREEGRFTPFLYTLLLNRIRKLYRGPRTQEIPLDLSSSDDPEEAAAQREIFARLEAVFQRLPLNHKAALTLYALEGLPYEQIARTLNASLAQVKIWIYRAREALRQELGDEAP